jgi:hypothetical protein
MEETRDFAIFFRRFRDFSREPRRLAAAYRNIPAKLSSAKTITCDFAPTPHLENIGQRAKARRTSPEIRSDNPDPPSNLLQREPLEWMFALGQGTVPSCPIPR